MPKHEELAGEFSFERHAFGIDDARTIIGSLADKTTVKGRAREDELECGMTYLFRGNWTTHERYGRQFAFYSFSIAQPAGQRGTIAYLQRGPNIGRKRAMTIWEKFGEGSLDAIRKRPDEVAAAVSGLTATMAREAAAYFQAHIDREIVTRDLEELLTGGGFPKKLIDKLIEKWGARAAAVVRENAYSLMIFPNVGFGRADKLYLQLGGDPANPERLGWCAQHALASDRNGHTWLEPDAAETAIRKSVAGIEARPGAGIAWAIERGIVAAKTDDAGRVWIAEGGRAANEARLANQVWRAMREGKA